MPRHRFLTVLKAWRSRIRCFIRRRKWHKVPNGIELSGSDGLYLVRPIRAVGFSLVVQFPDRRMQVAELHQSSDRKAFLQAWYALGGPVMFDDEGFAYDPEWH